MRVGKYVDQLGYRPSGSIDWSHTKISCSYMEAIAMEKDGWQLPHAMDFKFLPCHNLPYVERKLVCMYGYFWTRDMYQIIQRILPSSEKMILPSQLYIGYNATFDYYVLRMSSEKLQVSLVKYR